MTPITIVTGPRQRPGMITFRSPGGCDWTGKANCAHPGTSADTAWRADAGCAHEHITTVWLCGGCKDRLIRFSDLGVLFCRDCREAGARAHYCHMVASAVPLRVETFPIGG